MTQAQKIERLKYHGTSYEIVATNGERAVFVMYSAKSGQSIYRGMQADNWKRLRMLSDVVGVPAESWGYDRKGINSGSWVIKASGRTQREAILSGELQDSIYNQVVNA